ASRAYVIALANASAISAADARALDAGLAAVLGDATDAALAAAPEEDVHSWVEARLTERVGDLAGQAHLGRSRNEQAVTALRLWIRAAIDRLRVATASLVHALADQGTAGADAVMPGFTHTRAAEPITFGHFAGAHLQTHLSRLAEDLIWLSSPEFGYFALPEAYTTGSSLMPQKQNPDALELVRGKAARAQAGVLRLLVLMKSLPAGYQKDLQEDKEAVFDVADTAAGSLAVMRGVVSGLTIDREAMRRAAAGEEMMAAGLAVALAREGLPFRKAHALVGSLVAEARKTGTTLKEAAARVLPAHSPAVAARLEALFD